jgi:hypothetical protein
VGKNANRKSVIMVRTRRTKVNFSGYILSITRTDLIDIYDLNRDGAMIGRVKFSVMKDVTVVTGDFGNWMFSRPFVPEKDGYVSDGYWIEKLEMSSTQKGKDYSSKETEKELRRGIRSGLKEYGYEGEKLKQAKQFYKNALCYVDSKKEYEDYAYSDEKPKFMDYEDIPFVETTKYWLNVVFDAFEEICRRM